MRLARHMEQLGGQSLALWYCWPVNSFTLHWSSTYKVPSFHPSHRSPIKIYLQYSTMPPLCQQDKLSHVLMLLVSAA